MVGAAPLAVWLSSGWPMARGRPGLGHEPGLPSVIPCSYTLTLQIHGEKKNPSSHTHTHTQEQRNKHLKQVSETNRNKHLDHLRDEASTRDIYYKLDFIMETDALTRATFQNEDKVLKLLYIL